MKRWKFYSINLDRKDFTDMTTINESTIEPQPAAKQKTTGDQYSLGEMLFFTTIVFIILLLLLISILTCRRILTRANAKYFMRGWCTVTPQRCATPIQFSNDRTDLNVDRKDEEKKMIIINIHPHLWCTSSIDLLCDAY